MRKNDTEFREKGHEKIGAGEYLYKVRKGDRIRPVATLVIYWGTGPGMDQEAYTSCWILAAQNLVRPGNSEG